MTNTSEAVRRQQDCPYFHGEGVVICMKCGWTPDALFAPATPPSPSFDSVIERGLSGGKDLPDGPGVWIQQGNWWSVRSFELQLYGRMLYFENVPSTHDTGQTKYVNDMPKGGWSRAIPAADVDALKAENVSLKEQVESHITMAVQCRQQARAMIADAESELTISNATIAEYKAAIERGDLIIKARSTVARVTDGACYVSGIPNFDGPTGESKCS